MGRVVVLSVPKSPSWGANELPQVGDKGLVMISGPDGSVAAEFGRGRVWLSRDEYEPCH
jgi:hypothetical protein